MNGKLHDEWNEDVTLCRNEKGIISFNILLIIKLVVLLKSDFKVKNRALN